MNKTRIEWCDATFNPVVGCTFSCPYCYARTMAKRFGKKLYGRDDFVPTWIERNFNREFPKKPARIFVNSMSDVADWEPEWINKVLARIDGNPEHTFLFLTKRPDIYQKYKFPRNAWLGCTTTGFAGAVVDWCSNNLAFLSAEPLLGPMAMLDKRYSWVIIGAESGNRKDKVIPEKEWIDRLTLACLKNHIPVFMKDSLIPIMGEAGMIREFPENAK